MLSLVSLHICQQKISWDKCFDLREIIICAPIDVYISFIVFVDRNLYSVAVKSVLKFTNKINYKYFNLGPADRDWRLPPRSRWVCALQGHYSASSGNFSPTFRDDLSVRNYHYYLRNNPEERSCQMTVFVLGYNFIKSTHLWLHLTYDLFFYFANQNFLFTYHFITYHFIHLFYSPTILFTYHFIHLFYSPIILFTYHFIHLSFYSPIVLFTNHFIHLPFYSPIILFTYFIHLSFYLPIILFIYRFIHQSFYSPTILFTYHFIHLSFYSLIFYSPIILSLIILFTYRFIHLSFYSPIILFTYHFIHLSFYSPIILFTYHFIHLSFYSPIILFTYHFIHLSFIHLSFYHLSFYSPIISFTYHFPYPC